MAKKTEKQKALEYVMRRQPLKPIPHPLFTPANRMAIDDLLGNEERANLEKISAFTEEYLHTKGHTTEMEEQHKWGFRTYKILSLSLPPLLISLAVAVIMMDNFFIPAGGIGIGLSAVIPMRAIYRKTNMREYYYLKEEANRLEQEIKGLQYTPEYAKTMTRLEAHAMMTGVKS